jgi:glutamine amidotransferase
MCELMGLSFAEPVAASFLIREFAARDVENADGWGLAWYPDPSLALVKEALTWRQSGYSQFLESYEHLQARIYLAHVRHRSTSGEPTHADTHPFSREQFGSDYCFAHNGTIPGYAALPLGLHRPIGGTDSEHVFCHLLHRLYTEQRTLDVPADWQWLHALLSALNEHGTINCLLSDGRRLFAYRDVTAWKGLALRKIRFHGQAQRHFEDATMEINVVGDATNHGCVLATRPLSDTGWHDLKLGELVVIEAGRLAYSSHSSGSGPLR